MGSYFFKKYRGVVQLVERRSPKPNAVGSSPATPANIQGPLAQWLEHPAHNRSVLGSNPRRPTTTDVHLVDFNH